LFSDKEKKQPVAAFFVPAGCVSASPCAYPLSLLNPPPRTDPQGNRMNAFGVAIDRHQPFSSFRRMPESRLSK
jgi:hypothetical protein